jgi:capsular polysaccharide biosynthesis protein
MDDGAGFITLGELTGGLRRKWYVVAAAAALGVLLGGGLVAKSSAKYTSEAQLIVNPITTDPFAANSRPVDAVNPETERSVIRGSDVAQAVIDQLDLDTTPSNLLDRVTVENPEGSLSLRVSVQASSPERAQELANAFAATYLAQRSEKATDTIDQLVADIDAEIQTTQERLTEVIANSATVDGSTFAGQQVEAELSSLRTRIASLEERRTELLTTSTSPGRITREADLPGSGDGLPSIVLFAGAVALTTTLGAVLALLLDRRGGRVKDATALEVLGHGARVEIVRDRTDLEGAVGSTILAVQNSTREPVLLLSCSVDKDGSLSLTDELARGLSAAGLPTVVMWTGEGSPPEGDVVREDLERLCHGELGPLDASGDPLMWIVPANRSGVSTLAREDLPSNVTDWAVKSGYEVVLISTPSPWLQPAVAGLARRVDDVNLLVDGFPRRSDLASTVDALNSAGVGVRRMIVVTDSGLLEP